MIWLYLIDANTPAKPDRGNRAALQMQPANQENLARIYPSIHPSIQSSSHSVMKRGELAVNLVMVDFNFSWK